MERITGQTDTSWRLFFRAGGISALLYVLLGIIVPFILVAAWSYDFHMDAEVLLKYIALHKVMWMTLQTLVLGTSILAIVAFVSLFLALKHVNKSLAALGAMVTSACQVLFMAYYPVLLGLVYLSNQYETASAVQQDSIVSSADALLAINNAFNPLYESVFATGILIISIVMLKGVFHKYVAWIGIAIAPVAFIGLSLWTIIGVGYFWWWLLFVIWFTAVGWKLYRLGQNDSRDPTSET